MGTKSIIGMFDGGGGEGQLAPAGAAYDMAIWVAVVGGSWLGGSYQPDVEPQYAFPATQAFADLYRLEDGGLINAAYGETPYTYNRLYFNDSLNWECPWNATLSKIALNVTVNNRISPTTLTIYRNGVATGLSVTVPRLTTGIVLGTGSMTVVAGDVIVGKVTSSSQDSTDPDYVSEEITFSSLTMILDAEGASACLPYRTSLHDSNLTSSVIAESDWPPLDEVDSAVTAFGLLPDIGHLIDDGTNWAEYLPVPLVEIQNGGFASLNLSKYSSGVSYSEAEARRICQLLVKAPGTYSNMRALMWQSTISGSPLGNNETRELDFVLESNGTAVKTLNVPLHDYAGQLNIVGTYAAASGELLNFAVKKDGTGSTDNRDGWLNFRADFVSADEWFDIQSMGYDSNGMTTAQYTSRALTISSDSYFSIISGSDQDMKRLGIYSSRTYHETPITEATEFKNLRCQVGYISGGTVRVGLLIDGVKSNQYVDVTATGWHVDTTHDNDTTNCSIGQMSRVCYYVEKLTGTPVVRFDSFGITARIIDQPGTGCGGTDRRGGGGDGGGPTCIDGTCYNCITTCPEGMSLGEMRYRTFRMLGDDMLDPQYWGSAEVNRYINDAYHIACRDSKAVQYIEGVYLTADQNHAALSDQVGQIQRVTFEDRVLNNVTKWEMDRTLPNWESYSGYIERYVTSLHDTRDIGVYKAWDGTATYSYGPWMSQGAHTYLPWDDVTDYAIGDRVTVVDANGIEKGYYAKDASAAVDAAYYEPEVGSDWTDVWEPIGFMVWSVMNPPELEECDEPLLPPWSHLGLCFAAASMALEKYGEMRNPELGKVYGAIAKGYMDVLKSHVGNRTPERLVGMGQTRFSQMGPVPLPPLVTP